MLQPFPAVIRERWVTPWTGHYCRARYTINPKSGKVVMARTNFMFRLDSFFSFLNMHPAFPVCNRFKKKKKSWHSKPFSTLKSHHSFSQHLEGILALHIPNDERFWFLYPICTANCLRCATVQGLFFCKFPTDSLVGLARIAKGSVQSHCMPQLCLCNVCRK